MDRFARLFGTAFLLALTWPGSAAANARQSAALNPREAKLPRAQLRTVVQEDHRVVIDSDGVSPETSKYEAQLEHMFRAIEHQPRRRLLLFVHGGLTTLQTANRDKFFEVLRRFASDPRASQKDNGFFRAGLQYVPGKPRRPTIGLFLGPDSSDTIRAGLVTENVLTAPLQFTTEPALDTVGTAAWKNMLRRTRTMFYPAGNFITTIDQRDGRGNLYPGAAALFFAALDRFLNAIPPIVSMSLPTVWVHWS